MLSPRRLSPSDEPFAVAQGDPTPAEDDDTREGRACARSRALDLLLGTEPRVRTRVSQTLLGMLPLLSLDALLILRWRQGELGGAALGTYMGLTLAGCLVFFALLRSGQSERISREPSLSAPQMACAMLCVGWAYALAGPERGLLLCLMPVILCFGLFALRARAARVLALFGVLTMGAEMMLLALLLPERFPLPEQVAHLGFLFMSVAMVQVLALRLARIRYRLRTQKADLAQALERISVLATRDALTGLMNRRAAHEELIRAASQSAREGHALVLALVDLDHFKRVNDRFGHQVGDRVLQLFAHAAERELRSADRVVRWGGEEFLFVLPGTDEAEAGVALQRLREVYAATEAEGLPEAVQLSFSAGVARCRGEADIEAAIDRADKCLYQAKQSGRGRTCSTVPELEAALAG
jgi:diguanylate cyclase (GGDEF)-like protein